MNNLNEIVRGGNLCFGKAGLAIGTTTSDIKTAAAIDYAVNGILHSKAATDNIPMTAADAQAVSTSCLYLVVIDATGAVSTVKGDEVLTADIASGKQVLTWPQPTSNEVTTIGAIRIDTSSAVSFIAGTTALDATGITATFYDLFALPAQPLTT